MSNGLKRFRRQAPVPSPETIRHFAKLYLADATRGDLTFRQWLDRHMALQEFRPRRRLVAHHVQRIAGKGLLGGSQGT